MNSAHNHAKANSIPEKEHETEVRGYSRPMPRFDLVFLTRVMVVMSPSISQLTNYYLT